MLLAQDLPLSLEQLYSLGHAQQDWELDAEALLRVERAYRRLEQHLECGDQSIYGVHTHFGHNAADKADSGHWVEHQMGLLSYLSVGFGPCFPEAVVRRALRLQVYKVALGYSGVHPSSFQALRELADTPDLPKVPSMGSLGASGDLIPMAHAIAPLFATRLPAGPRDVLALLNTNAMMASLAVECHAQLRQLQDLATCGWLIHAEALGWKGYGRQMEGSLARSTKLSDRKAWIEQLQVWQVALDQKRSRDLRVAAMPVQERYSIRCAPQILLDIAENLQFAADKIAEEALGLADNPILLEDGIWHGGLFYTAGLSTAAELMQNAVLRMADLMDKQILLTVTPELNHGLPANLMRHAGDHVKGLHQLASAILQKIRGMSQPPALLSFSCESHNQDVVPASMTALLLLQESLGLVQEIARIHFFIGERAWALRYQDYLPESLYLAAWSEYRVDRNLAAYLCPR